jgi:hypothetical protein
MMIFPQYKPMILKSANLGRTIIFFPLLPRSDDQAASSMDQLGDGPYDQKADPHQKKNGQDFDKNAGKIEAIIARVSQVERVQSHFERHLGLIDGSFKIFPSAC